MLSHALRTAAELVDQGDLQGAMSLLVFRCACGRGATYVGSNTEFYCSLHSKKIREIYKLPTFSKPSLERCTALTQRGQPCANPRKLGSHRCGLHHGGEPACSSCRTPIDPALPIPETSLCCVSCVESQSPRPWPALMQRVNYPITMTTLNFNDTYVKLWDHPCTTPPVVEGLEGKDKLAFMTAISDKPYEEVAHLYARLAVYIDTLWVEGQTPEPWTRSWLAACRFKLLNTPHRERWERVATWGYLPTHHAEPSPKRL